LQKTNENATSFKATAQHHMMIRNKHGLLVQEWHTIMGKKYCSLLQSGSNGKSLPFVMIVEDHDVPFNK
jgi:hypothetical protein